MIKRINYAVIITFIMLNICSCALFQKPIDKKTGFSNSLKQTENYIRNDDWENAKTSLGESTKTWEKIKPILQIDIDHDYVESIEEDFVKLLGYIDTKEKSESLITILLVQDIWKNIGTL